MTNALVKLEDARNLLEEVRSIPEAKRVMDLADAAKIYAKKAKLGEESELFAHAIKIDAQTILGDCLDGMPQNGRGRPPKNSPTNGGISKNDLKEVGITKHQAEDSKVLSRAKRKAPKLHAQVRNGKVRVRDVSKRLIRYQMTDAEREAADKKAALDTTIRFNTKQIQKVCEFLLAGSSARKIMSAFDATKDPNHKDPKRCLTPTRLRLAAQRLMEFADEWEKIEHENKERAA